MSSVLEGLGILDTSVFIAGETGRSMGRLPERVAVSVITLGELRLGVLNAPDEVARARRGETLEYARAWESLPVTESVMDAWAALVKASREAGIRRLVRLTDSMIAATAIDLGVPVVTQDSDYDEMAIAHPALTVLRV